MAQTEDTELRDLVIEALEKNGSLAKIRALLRANIFLAFEEECENVRHNMSLDGVLRSPEGALALCVVHEFLEFCNLKNTLFVYKAESRQGRDYKFEGKCLRGKLGAGGRAEPALLALIRSAGAGRGHGDARAHSEDSGDSALTEFHNGSYTAHSESASSASSPASAASEGGADRQRLQLRLQLEHSDTESSSEGSRARAADSPRRAHSPPQALSLPNYFTKAGANTSSDSTSYVDLQPFSSADEKMLNTPGLPTPLPGPPHTDIPLFKHRDHSTSESSKSAPLSSVAALSARSENRHGSVSKHTSQEQQKSDGETGDYSLDFSISQESKNNISPNKKNSLDSPKDDGMEIMRSSGGSSPQHSSVSVSDVAELVSEHSSSEQSSLQRSTHKSNATESPRKSPLHTSNKAPSEDSGDYSESPVPSLSNLSLDVHSD